MKRRDFIKKASLTAAATFVAPYILPSGRLFAGSGTRKVNHVVFCMFAGGIRNRESVKQEESNLMNTMLNDITAYDSSKAGYIDNVGANPLGSSRLQEFGTLLKEVRFAEGATGHYNAHMVAMTGKYQTSAVNLRANPEYPTIFEYYRKHNDSAKTSSATDAWWISDALGPYPLLNYSSHSSYGAAYGANYIQPKSLITVDGYNAIGDPKNFTTSQEDLAGKLRGFCDGNFADQYQAEAVGLVNTIDDQKKIQAFFDFEFNNAPSDPYGISGGMNSDLWNIYYAEQVIMEFQPELTVLNIQDVDICHSDFTKYATTLQKADWGVSHLWQTIQNTPGMADDTVLIVMPEHGRNDAPNTLVDQYGRPAYDHTNDEASREIFALICGPSDVIKQNHTISEVYGESVDIVPTIANLLGFDTDIPASLIDGQVLTDIFV